MCVCVCVCDSLSRSLSASLPHVQSNLALATRSDNPQYLAEDIDVFDWALTEEEMTILDNAREPQAPTGGGKGGGPCLFCHD